MYVCTCIKLQETVEFCTTWLFGISDASCFSSVVWSGNHRKIPLGKTASCSRSDKIPHPQHGVNVWPGQDYSVMMLFNILV